MSDRKLILYHGNCTDGFTAAWCAHQKLGDTADYMEMKNDGADFPVDGREVIFLDCCPKREQLLAFKQRAKSIMVLDHHVTGKDNCGDIEGCVFDMNHSGAGMAAQHFLEPNHPGHLMVRYVEDADLYTLRLGTTREVSAFMFSHPYSFQRWTSLAHRFNYDFASIVAEGEAILRSKEVDMEQVRKKVTPMTICGYDNVPVINMSHGDISTLLSQLAQNAPNFFAISWHLSEPGKFKYSIRSNGMFDCATFASMHFGGGGHKGAAAWVSNRPPWDLSISPRFFEKNL